MRGCVLASEITVGLRSCTLSLESQTAASAEAAQLFLRTKSAQMNISRALFSARAIVSYLQNHLRCGGGGGGGEPEAHSTAVPQCPPPHPWEVDWDSHQRQRALSTSRPHQGPGVCRFTVLFPNLMRYHVSILPTYRGPVPIPLTRNPFKPVPF